MSKITEALAFMKKQTKDVDMDVSETCQLLEFKEQHKNTHHEGGTSGNDSDEDMDDDARGGTRVKCNQQ